MTTHGEILVYRTEDETGWSPYMSLEDACKLEDVREALRSRDLHAAGMYGEVFRMVRVEA